MTTRKSPRKAPDEEPRYKPSPSAELTLARRNLKRVLDSPEGDFRSAPGVVKVRARDLQIVLDALDRGA